MATPLIVFSHETALLILRFLKNRGTVCLASKASELPTHHVNDTELKRIITSIENSFDMKLPKPIHCITHTRSHGASSNDVVRHITKSSLPQFTMIEITPNVYVCDSALAFTQIATRSHLRKIELIELAWELCGTYQTNKTGLTCEYNVKPLCCVDKLEKFAMNNSAVFGTRSLAGIIRYICNGSASPCETKLALLMALPKHMGGYGYGMPHMNYLIEADKNGQLNTLSRAFRGDVCWPDIKVILEYQSTEFHNDQQKHIDDSLRANSIMSMGWQVFFVTNTELHSRYATDSIAEAMRLRMKKRKTSYVSDYDKRKMALREQLGIARWDEWV